jgi:hypothetical protein
MDYHLTNRHSVGCRHGLQTNRGGMVSVLSNHCQCLSCPATKQENTYEIKQKNMKTLPLLVGSGYCYVYNVGGKQEKLVHNI